MPNKEMVARPPRRKVVEAVPRERPRVNRRGPVIGTREGDGFVVHYRMAEGAMQIQLEGVASLQDVLRVLHQLERKWGIKNGLVEAPRPILMQRPFVGLKIAMSNPTPAPVPAPTPSTGKEEEAEAAATAAALHECRAYADLRITPELVEEALRTGVDSARSAFPKRRKRRRGRGQQAAQQPDRRERPDRPSRSTPPTTAEEQTLEILSKVLQALS